MDTEIRKYYKDFNADTAFANKDEIEVTRVVFFINNHMFIFLDLADEDNLNNVKESLEEGNNITFSDIYSGPQKKTLTLPRENLKMVEFFEGLTLTKEDFELDQVNAKMQG